MLIYYNALVVTSLYLPFQKIRKINYIKMKANQIWPSIFLIISIF